MDGWCACHLSCMRADTRDWEWRFEQVGNEDLPGDGASGIRQCDAKGFAGFPHAVASILEERYGVVERDSHVRIQFCHNDHDISVWKRMAKELLLSAMRADSHEFNEIMYKRQNRCWWWCYLIRGDLLRHISATGTGRLAKWTFGVNKMGYTVSLVHKSH